METRLAALADASARIFAARSLDETLRLISEAARDLVGAHQAVTSLTTDGSWARAIVSVVLSDKYAAWRAFDATPAGRGIHALVCADNVPMRLTQAELEAHPHWRRFGDAEDRHPPPRGWLAAPLVARDGANLGLVRLSDKYDGEFDAGDEAMLVQLARFAALAIENRRLMEAAHSAERRFEAFATLGNEVLWETDAQHRYTGFAAKGSFKLRRPPEEFIGKTRWEALGFDPGAPFWAAHIADLEAHRPLRGFEYQAELGDGKLHWVRLNAEPQFDAAGAFAGYRGTTQDVTELREAEAAAKASEERFRRFAEIASDWVWESDADHRFTYFAGPQGVLDRRPYGVTRWELAGADTGDPKWRAHIADLEAGRPFRDFEYAPTDPKGRKRHLSVSGDPILDAAGKVAGYRGTTTDLTLRREAEAAARKAADQYRSIVETANEGVWILDDKARTVFVNRRMAEMLGYAPEEMIGREVYEFRPPEDRQGRARRWERRMEGVSEQREARFTRRDGTVFWAQVSASAMKDAEGNFAGALGMVSDITARKEAEEALKASEERFRDFAQVASDWMWETDARHRFSYFSPSRDTSQPDSSSLAIGKTRWEFAGGDPSDTRWRAHIADLEAHRPFRGFEYNYRRPDGSLGTYVVGGVPVFADDGTFLGHRGTTSDITARRNAEAAALASEQKYRHIVEMAHEGIWMLDADRRTTYVNPRMAEMLGYAPEEMQGRHHWDFMAQADRAAAIQATRQRLGDGVERAELRYLRKDGSPIWVIVTSNIVEDPSRGALAVLGMVTDITDRKTAEEAAAASEARFRDFAEIASDWMWETDREHRLSSFVGPDPVVAGWQIGLRRWEVPGADADPELWKRHRAVLAARAPFRDFEYRAVGVDGRPRWISVSGRPVFGPAGSFEGYRGVSSNVTALKQAEAALLQSEQRFRDFAEIASDWMWETDAEHRLTFICGEGLSSENEPYGSTRWALAGAGPDDPQWRDHVADLEARRPFRDFEFTVQGRSGRTHHLVAGGRPIFAPDGAFLGYRGTTSNRTLQREAEAAAAESEKRFRQFVETANEGVWMVDTEMKTTYVNRRVAEMLGVPAGEMIGRPFTDFKFADDVPKSFEAWDESARTGLAPVENRLRRSDGSTLWVLMSTVPQIDKQGRFSGVSAMMVDITDRKAAERQARQTSRRLEEVLASITEGFVLYDREMRVLHLNPAAERIGKKPAKEIVGRIAFEALGMSADNPIYLFYKQVMETGEPASCSIWSQVFEIWLELHAYPQGEGVAAFFHEVTDQRRAHLALAESDRQLRAALESNQSILASISDGFVALDNAWRFTFVNPAAERMWGLKAADLLGKTILNSLNVDPSNPFQSNYLESKRTGEPVAFAAHSDIFDKWIEVRGYPHPGGYTLFFDDVTEEREAHRALLKSRKKLEAARETNERIFETSLDLICITDRTGTFVEVNPGACQQFGYAKEELVGHNASEFIDAEGIVATRVAMREARKSQSQHTFENKCRRKSGQWVPVNWSVAWSEREQKFFLIGRDMSERLAAQERLARSQRLEAIGQLTGGIAHDFNNLLTVIMGNSDTLARGLADREHLRRRAELSLEAARRAAELTAQLLSFARRQTLAPKAVAANKLVADMHELMRRALGAEVEIGIVPAAALWLCKVDSTQLETALLNLALNARDAMPGGGRLAIATANRTVAAGEPGVAGELAAGDYVAIAVTDTGAGMTPEVMARAFEPFFTTKDIGKGSGLGLAMVYGFVKQSGGGVAIESAPGRGTKVTLYLPRAHEALGAAPSPPAREGAPLPGGRETILVVEDDPAVRELVTDQLKGLGYRVLVAGNGSAARNILFGGEKVDLLFTDVMMPGGITGTELADEAERQIPGLKILFTTGYSEVPALKNSRGGAALLRKPYKTRDLARTVRETLDAAA